MSYEKQTWATGDVITAEKLNHMEDGIEDADGVFIARYRYAQTPTGHNPEFVPLTCDNTAQEIYNAIHAGKYVVALTDDGCFCPLTSYYYDDESGEISLQYCTEIITVRTSTSSVPNGINISATYISHSETPEDTPSISVWLGSGVVTVTFPN